MSQLYHKKETKGLQKCLFNTTKGIFCTKKSIIYYLVFFCTKLLIYLNKTSTLRIKIGNNNSKKSFFFTFFEICTFCLNLNYNFDIELRTISKRINRQITTESKHIFSSRRSQFLEGFLQNFRLNYKWKNMYCFLFDILHSFSKSTAHTTFINNLQYPYK